MADPVTLVGVVGTWVAALLALVALVGIVTPWLLLRAVHSDRNRRLMLLSTSTKNTFPADSASVEISDSFTRSRFQGLHRSVTGQTWRPLPSQKPTNRGYWIW
jgi:hypothetical protein